MDQVSVKILPDEIILEVDTRKITVRVSQYPELLKATESQLRNVCLIGDQIIFYDLDVDIDASSLDDITAFPLTWQKGVNE